MNTSDIKPGPAYWLSATAVAVTFGTMYFGSSMATTGTPNHMLTRILAIVAFLIAFAVMVLRPRAKLRYKPQLIVALGLLLAISMASVALSDVQGIALTGLNDFSLIFIAAIISSSLVKHLDKLCRLLCTLTAGITFIIIYRYGTSAIRVGFAGPFVSPNSLGLLLSLGLFCSLYLVLVAPSKRNLLVAIISAAISMPILLYTNSRTAVLAPTVAAAVWLSHYVVVTVKHTTTRKVVYGGVVLIALVIALTFVWPTIQEGIIVKFANKSASDSGVTSGRTAFLAIALVNSRYFTSGNIPPNIYIDNTIISLAAKFGIATAATFCLLVTMYIVRALRIMRTVSIELNLFIFAYFIYYACYMMFEDIIKTPYTLIFFAILFFLYKKRRIEIRGSHYGPGV